MHCEAPKKGGQCKPSLLSVAILAQVSPSAIREQRWWAQTVGAMLSKRATSPGAVSRGIGLQPKKRARCKTQPEGMRAESEGTDGEAPLEDAQSCSTTDKAATPSKKTSTRACKPLFVPTSSEMVKNFFGGSPRGDAKPAQNEAIVVVDDADDGAKVPSPSCTADTVDLNFERELAQIEAAELEDGLERKLMDPQWASEGSAGHLTPLLPGPAEVPTTPPPSEVGAGRPAAVTEEPPEKPADAVSDAMASLYGAIAEKTLANHWEKQTGVPLTEANVKHFEHTFSDVADRLHNTTGDNTKGGDGYDRFAHLSKREKKNALVLQEAMQAGDFSGTSYLAAKFREKYPKGTAAHEEFKGMSAEDQLKFKQKWMKMELGRYTESKRYEKSWRRIDTNSGKMKPLGRIVVDEGGWDDPYAVAGTLELVSQCLLMGGPFVGVHPQTKRKIFLHLEFGFEEQFSECWAHFREEFEHGTLQTSASSAGAGSAGTRTAAAAAAPAGAAAAAAETAAPASAAAEKEDGAQGTQQDGKGKGKGKAKAKAKGLAKQGKPQKEGDDGQDDQKKEAQKSLADATKFKDQFLKTLSQASQLTALIEESVDEGDPWFFAKNPQNLDKLKELSSVLRKSFDEFGQEFIYEEISTIRKRYNQSKIEVGIKKLLEAQGPLKAVKKFVEVLVKRKNS